MRALPILLLFGAMFYWLWRGSAAAASPSSCGTSRCGDCHALRATRAEHPQAFVVHELLDVAV